MIIKFAEKDDVVEIRGDPFQPIDGMLATLPENGGWLINFTGLLIPEVACSIILRIMVGTFEAASLQFKVDVFGPKTHRQMHLSAHVDPAISGHPPDVTGYVVRAEWSAVYGVCRMRHRQLYMFH